MIYNVIKIDICKSKAFAGERDSVNPEVRKGALAKLLDVTKRRFPYADEPFPRGSFYKADGDAIYYILERPSVALRASIEFMQDWYYVGLREYPDCRVFIDQGFLQTVDVPGKTELVGKPFENISVFEKGIDEGRIYLTKNVAEQCDQTIANFVLYNEYTPRPSDTIALYFANFLDPRTVADSSLIHALFVAHKQSAEARDRVFELFFIECLLEKGVPCDLQTMLSWGRARNYPLPPTKQSRELLKKSQLIEVVPSNGDERYQIKLDAVPAIAEAKQEFCEAQRECLNEVSASVIEKTRSEKALAGVNLTQLVEEYLCAVFSEIRMMANYFRSTFHLFESGPETFRRFNYVFKRHLAGLVGSGNSEPLIPEILTRSVLVGKTSSRLR